jgi:chromosome segregation ATPase
LEAEELSLRHHGALTDLDKLSQQLSQLKTDNDSLRNDLKNYQDKLEKKHEKYCALESKIKTENDKRLKALETEIYSLQEANNQLEIKLELSKHKGNPQDRKGECENELVDLLKMEVKEKERRVKELEAKQREAA